MESILLANDCPMTTRIISFFTVMSSVLLFGCEYSQKAMYLVCCESVAEMKTYNVKRHYDWKHKKDFDSAYPGKGERLKVFKKCFNAYVCEAKTVDFCESSQRS